MSTNTTSDLLYTALMLRKLHERQGFSQVLDASTDGRYRTVLEEHLPGAGWIAAQEVWTPMLHEVRLCRHADRLGCTDIRLAAAASTRVELALFEGVLEPLQPPEAQALAAAWLAHTPLVLISLLATLPVAPALPGLVSHFISGTVAVCCLTRDPERARQISQLHQVISGIVQRMTERP